MGQTMTGWRRVHASREGFYSVETTMPDLVRMTIEGFWTREIMADFLRDVKQAIVALPCPAGSHRVLCDVTDSALQSQANCGDFIRLLTDDRLPARGIAFVTRNPASRMQVRRLMAGQANASLFEEEARAVEWLRFGADDDV